MTSATNASQSLTQAACQSEPTATLISDPIAWLAPVTRRSGALVAPFAGAGPIRRMGCQDLPVRIGTWNLEGRWSPAHRDLLQQQACDVWLLTEVPDGLSLGAAQIHHTAERMSPRRYWAAVVSAWPLTAEWDPHRATASASIDGVRFMSSVLPWRTCGESWPGQTLADKQQAALDALHSQINSATVWGGDWNQALEGPEYVGSSHGRKALAAIMTAARLSVPTASLGSASPGHRSIDHIAVPAGWDVAGVNRITVGGGPKRLSDHDAYVVEIAT